MWCLLLPLSAMRATADGAPLTGARSCATMPWPWPASLYYSESEWAVAVLLVAARCKSTSALKVLRPVVLSGFLAALVYLCVFVYRAYRP